MVRRNVESDAESDKARVRLFYVEVEGNNASILEGIRTLSAALHRPNAAVVEPRRMVAAAPARSGRPDEAAQKVVPDDASLDQQDAPNASSLEESTVADVTQNEAPREPRPRASGPRRDHNASLRLVPDLNLHPDGNESLVDFVARHPTDQQQEQVALFVYYLKQVLSLEKATTDHVFTCFREADWTIPANLPQTIRNVKSRTAWIGGERENLTITTVGINFVERELVRAPTASE